MLLYIDPGTGSMLFTILVGLLGAGFFGAKKLFIKLKFLFSGGTKEKQMKNVCLLLFLVIASVIGTFLSQFVMNLKKEKKKLFI